MQNSRKDAKNCQQQQKLAGRKRLQEMAKQQKPPIS